MKWLIIALLLLISNVCFAASPMEEYKAAETFLLSQPESERSYIKFFAYSEISKTEKIEISGKDVSAIGLDLQTAVGHALKFWVHSLSSINKIAVPRRVPNAPEMYWVDIRDYGWTPQAWEKISEQDPYYREPWITYEMSSEEYQLYHTLRVAHGNFIVKAVWFIVQTSDAMKQQDFDKPPLYYELLYAGRNIPKNVDEFREAWGVNKNFEKEAQIYNLITGKLVDTGDSGVARHNRILARIRTLFGSFNETSDVKNGTGKRDFIENLEPNKLAHSVRDAGEIISHNPVGLQVYFLCDGKGNRVEFADPAVAWDRSNREDIRVKTARSCVTCHAIGLNPAIDGFAKLLLGREVELYTYDKDIQLQIEAFYSTEYGQLIKDDNEIFARAIARINGLEPQQNAYIYRRVINYYEEFVTLDRAAAEVGLEVEEFKKRIQPTISGRLGSLFKENGKIAREVWDNLEAGQFTTAMLFAYSIPENVKVVEETIKKLKVKIIQNTDLMDGNKKAGKLNVGMVYNIIEEREGWYQIEENGLKGWVYKDKVELIQ